MHSMHAMNWSLIHHPFYATSGFVCFGISYLGSIIAFAFVTEAIEVYNIPVLSWEGVGRPGPPFWRWKMLCCPHRLVRSQSMAHSFYLL